MATTNLHSIDNIEINGMDFKHLETTKDIVITLKNKYGRPAWPDTTHKWTAKVSDGTNYVGDYAVKINATNMIIDSEDFTKLPVGNYQLEVWEQWTDDDGNSQLSIYPSPKQTIPFNIYANIPDQVGEQIKKIGFQDVVDQAVMDIGMNYVFKVNTIDADQTATVVQTAADGKNYVTFNIPRGAKGDKGDQGLQGDKGDHGISIWSMRMAAGGSVSGRLASDLYNASATNLPAVNDLVVQPDGNVFSVTSATSGGGGGGGGTFDLGPALFSIKGEKGDKGDTGTVDNAGLTNAPAFQALQTQVNDSAVGTNLATGTDQEYTMGYEIPNTVWQDGYAYLKLPITLTASEIEVLPQDPHTFYYNLTPGQEYTQTVWLETDATVKDLSAAQITWYNDYGGGHDKQSATLINLGENKYKLYSTYKWPGKSDNSVRLFDIFSLDAAFDLSTGTYLKFGKLKLEEGTVSTDWCPNPTEILTQADYAKIKAAIVALGGSLS